MKPVYIIGGIIIVGIFLILFFVEQPPTEAKSPCSSTVDPDTFQEMIVDTMTPVANTATMQASNDTVCVFCIIPCSFTSTFISCNEEKGFAATYTYSIAESGGYIQEITLRPTGEAAASNATTSTETIMELQRLPDEWQTEPLQGFYNNHQLLILQILYDGEIDARDFTVVVSVVVTPTPALTLTFTPSPGA